MSAWVSAVQEVCGNYLCSRALSHSKAFDSRLSRPSPMAPAGFTVGGPWRRKVDLATDLIDSILRKWGQANARGDSLACLVKVKTSSFNKPQRET